MSERWVLNASPLIVLAQIGREDLFSLAEQVVIPRDVVDEIQAGPEDDRALKLLQAGKFKIVESRTPPLEILAWDLGAGESAVLSFAIAESGWTSILDDALARKCAQSFSISVRGTLGIVLLAKQRGMIPSAAEVVRALRDTGFRLDDQVVRDAVASVGEEWAV